MSDSKRTVGPWRAKFADGNPDGGIPIRAGGLLVAIARGAGGPFAECKANATFIVTACNAYDRLMAERAEMLAFIGLVADRKHAAWANTPMQQLAAFSVEASALLARMGKDGADGK